MTTTVGQFLAVSQLSGKLRCKVTKVIKRVKRRRRYTAGEKAEFILYCLRSGKTIVACCRDKNIPYSCVFKWREIFITGGIHALEAKTKTKRKPKQERLFSKEDKEKLSLLETYIKYLNISTTQIKELSNGRKTDFVQLVENSDLSKKQLLQTINFPRSTYYRWKYSQNITEETSFQNDNKKILSEDKAVKELVFKTLHTPPSDFGFNRTSWRLVDLQVAIQQSGLTVGRHTIRRVIKEAGYRWLKARKVLTSKDPEYTEKLIHIQQILKELRPQDGFFSIDEYGPFSIKHHQGRKLIPPGETFSVPQWQKSKGKLIVTAALELATNQVTHFYSEKKNTAEMIKLLDILLEKHQHLERIYLSWDAASWHISKKLYEKISCINGKALSMGATQIAVAPLPAGAQFLNVIEAIFSGMSRAIIHNSNYSSLEEAKNAIDRYFHERNSYFNENPQKAGNKIWGKEKIPAKFSDSQNCKDIRYM